MHACPATRTSTANDAPLRDRDYVLYWMTAQRRVHTNFALQHALHQAEVLRKPVLVFEALRLDAPWASQRLHRFVLDGMADNHAVCAAAGVTYYSYVEPTAGAGRGLLAALAAHACLVVTDCFPCFFLPRMASKAARRLDVRLGLIDGNGILPLAATDRAYTTAASFRRALQKKVRPHLDAFPVLDPLARYRGGTARLPGAVIRGWGNAPPSLSGITFATHVPATALRGGMRAGDATLRRFVRDRLYDYADGRNQPQRVATSELSPYLHFGHVSPHAVVRTLLRTEDWTPTAVAPKATGSREGWWGASPPVEAYLDQVVTWRELGFAFCHHQLDTYDRFDSLPDWAQRTLAEHADDPREHVYDLEQFDAAQTHDLLWNAAQQQLRQEGRIHNYLRMLWGKSILAWSANPQEALAIMIELNNRYALDGRDPNSYSGIFWVLGRFDRAWGPERPVFGKVRYMTSRSTAKKVRVRDYVRRWTGAEP